MMSISKAGLLDVAAIHQMVNSAYRGDTSKKGWTTEADLLDGIRIDEAMLKEYLNDSQSVILTCYNREQQLSGCVYLKLEGDEMYLGMLTVSPDAQGKGIGKLLLKESEKLAAEKGCQSIKMTVITSRTELIDWYKRHGYVETGEKQPFPTNERFGVPKMPLKFLVMKKLIQ